MSAQDAIDRAYAKAVHGMKVAEAEKNPTVQGLTLALTLAQVMTMLGEHVSESVS